jgi:hypothetical protein
MQSPKSRPQVNKNWSNAESGSPAAFGFAAVASLLVMALGISDGYAMIWGCARTCEYMWIYEREMCWNITYMCYHWMDGWYYLNDDVDGKDSWVWMMTDASVIGGETWWWFHDWSLLHRYHDCSSDNWYRHSAIGLHSNRRHWYCMWSNHCLQLSVGE